MYCRFCGKQVADEAYLCPSCGCLIKPLPQTEVDFAAKAVELPAKEGPSNAQKKLHKLSKIFTKVGIILNAIAFGFLVLGLIFFAVAAYGLSTYNELGGYYASSSEYYYGAIAEAQELLVGSCMGLYYCAMCTMSVSAISIELSTAGFVLSLIQKVDPAVKKKSIPVFVCSIVFFVLSIYGIAFMWYFLALAGV